jgi:hypothetical protein
MPGFMPGIHVLRRRSRKKTWMAGTSPAMTTERLREFGETV